MGREIGEKCEEKQIDWEKGGGKMRPMQKYRFPALSEVLTVKVGTKYVWEERVKQQATTVHMLEEIYGIKLNFRAFSFYPNYVYFGMPITYHPEIGKAKELWVKIGRVFSGRRWRVCSAFEHIVPTSKVPTRFDTFDDLGFDHVQMLLSELVIMDLNYPSIGVGQQMSLSLFQPLIGFSRKPVSRMAVGRPGSLILKYESEEELLNMLGEISRRKGYKEEPFYVKKSRMRFLKSVYKGKLCLNEVYSKQAYR